jgi:hypothetical protein
MNLCKLGTLCAQYSYFRLWQTWTNLVECCFIDVWSSVTWWDTQRDCVEWWLSICAAFPSDSNFINLLSASDKCTHRCRTSWSIVPLWIYMVYERIIAGWVLFHIWMLYKKCSGCSKVKTWEWSGQHSYFTSGRPLVHVFPRHQLTWQIF